ncbi:MAG: WXG100 family type VII secretion target [Candidatus Promineifilaceae bacterium]
MSNLIRVNYEELEQIAGKFSQEAERTQQTLASISVTMNQLREEGWIGRGSESFFHEMDELVVPAMRRLIEALSETGSMTLRTRSVMADAEDVASTEFATDESNNAGSAGGARAGSGGGVGSGGGGAGSGSTASAFDSASSSRPSSNNTPPSSSGGEGSSTFNTDATPSVFDSTDSSRSSSDSMPPASSGSGGGSGTFDNSGTLDSTAPSSSGSPSSGGGSGGSSGSGGAASDAQTGGANNSPSEATSPGGTSPADASGANPSGAQHSSVAGGVINSGTAPTITAANPLDIGIDNTEQNNVTLGLAAASPAAALLGKTLLDGDGSGT